MPNKTKKNVKCYRCLDQGHVVKDCTGKDCGNLCRKCCRPGHKSKECTETPRCILCQEVGLQEIAHYIGSKTCVVNRINTQNDD